MPSLLLNVVLRLLLATQLLCSCTSSSKLGKRSETRRLALETIAGLGSDSGYDIVDDCYQVNGCYACMHSQIHVNDDSFVDEVDTTNSDTLKATGTVPIRERRLTRIILQQSENVQKSQLQKKRKMKLAHDSIASGIGDDSYERCRWSEKHHQCVPNHVCDDQKNSSAKTNNNDNSNSPQSQNENNEDNYFEFGSGKPMAAESMLCCSDAHCCHCEEQSECKTCGSLGLNATCTWDHSAGQCLEGGHCPEAHECRLAPTLAQCLYTSGLCKAYFSKESFWVGSFLAMLVFMVSLPCCLYHKCGIDWDSEFKDRYTMERGDGYVFKGGASLTGKCMYTAFALISLYFVAAAFFGMIIHASCALTAF